MDIAVNPGPNTSTECTEDGSSYVNLNYWLSDKRKTYSHNELFIIRKTSRCTIQTDTLQILKINGIIRFRGTRAGCRRRNYRSKIHVHFSMRLDKAWWKGQPPVVFENRVLKPVVL